MPASLPPNAPPSESTAYEPWRTTSRCASGWSGRILTSLKTPPASWSFAARSLGASKLVVHSGHVTLTGTVDWLFQKQSAEDAMRHIRGVRGVLNYISVTPRAAVRDVRHRIVKALHQTADVDARHITVTVSGDTATLTGAVGPGRNENPPNERRRMPQVFATWTTASSCSPSTTRRWAIGMTSAERPGRLAARRRDGSAVVTEPVIEGMVLTGPHRGAVQCAVQLLPYAVSGARQHEWRRERCVNPAPPISPASCALCMRMTLASASDGSLRRCSVRAISTGWGASSQSPRNGTDAAAATCSMTLPVGRPRIHGIDDDAVSCSDRHSGALGQRGVDAFGHCRRISLRTKVFQQWHAAQAASGSRRCATRPRQARRRRGVRDRGPASTCLSPRDRR